MWLRVIKPAILVTDLLWIVGVCSLSLSIRHRQVEGGQLLSGVGDSLWLPLLTVALWAVLYAAVGLEGFRWGWNLPAVFSHLLVAVSLMGAVLAVAAFLVKVPVSGVALAGFMTLLFLGFLSIRCLARGLLFSKHWAGNVRRVVIMGNGHVARELARKIQRHPEMLCEVVAFLFPAAEDNDLYEPSDVVTVRTLGVLDLLESKKIDELLVVLPQIRIVGAQNLIARCRAQGIRVSLVPQAYELYISRPRLLQIDGLPLVSLDPVRMSWAGTFLKRVMDVILAAALMIPAIPILIACWASLRIKTGKVLRIDLRCGRDGEPFPMYRLAVDRKGANLSSLERFLDRTSLTELPQLLNVLRGEMSLVGPRPEPLERVQHYSDWQRQRLNVIPGMTGLAQVYGLREAHPSEEKARFDLQYILHWSPFLDVSLILQTVWTLAGRMYPRRSPPAPGQHGDSVVALPLDSLIEETVNAHRAQSCTD